MSDKEDLNESELNRLNSIHSHLINDDEYTRIKFSRELNFFNYNRNVKECLDDLAKLTGQLLKVSTASYHVNHGWIDIIFILRSFLYKYHLSSS